MCSLAIAFDTPKTPAEWTHAGVMLGTFVGLTALCISALLWIYRSRRRWNYWPKGRRVLAVWAAFLLTGGLHAGVALCLVALLW